MSKKHLNKRIINRKDCDNQPKQNKYINKNVASLYFGEKAYIFLSLAYIQHQWERFSDWEAKEMKQFWEFNSTIHQLTWDKAYSHSGLRYKKINENKYPAGGIKENLSPDVSLFEFRITDKARVHGFRINNIFFLCWLDRNHRICSI